MTFQKKLEEAARLLKEAGQEIKKGGVLRLEFEINLLPQKTVVNLGMFPDRDKFCNIPRKKPATAKK